jgi:hypothetical protein
MRTLWLLVALAACDKTPEPTPEPRPAGSQPAAQPAGSTRPAAPGAPSPGAAGDITWAKPNAWTQVDDQRPMRKATYKVTKVEGDPEDAEMSVTQVGGTVDANIKRWEGQFEGGGPAKLSDKEVAGLKVTIVEISGTFKGGGPMMGGDSTPKDNWALLGAIVHTQPAAYFFKMTGPLKTVESARGDFDGLVGSFAKK